MSRAEKAGACRLGSIATRTAVIVAAVAGAGAAYAQASLSYSIVADSGGNVIGQLSGNGASPDVDGVNFDLFVVPYTSAPADVKLSSLAPPPSATQTPVKVKVPRSATVATCAGSNVYNRKTGQCGDGKFPIKIVAVSQLSNPAAQMPGLACTAPKVPTFMTSWACLVPPGFKLSLGF